MEATVKITSLLIGKFTGYKSTQAAGGIIVNNFFLKIVGISIGEKNKGYK